MKAGKRAECSSMIKTEAIYEDAGKRARADPVCTFQLSKVKRIGSLEFLVSAFVSKGARENGRMHTQSSVQ